MKALAPFFALFAIPVAYFFGQSVVKDRKKHPTADIVHKALCDVMDDPPSFNKVFLWSVDSRRKALSWAQDPNQPKPYFL